MKVTFEDHDERARILAWAELNYLRTAGVLPDRLEGARIAPDSTPVYDLNGSLLFRRFPLLSTDSPGDFADVAVEPSLGGILLQVSSGLNWDEPALREQAMRELRQRRQQLEWDEVRFVAYSFPKVAVQFLRGGREIAMLELMTWRPVPPRRGDGPPSNFERWSLLDSMPPRERSQKRRRTAARVRSWATALADPLSTGGLALDRISIANFQQFVVQVPVRLAVDTRELHYSSRASDHATCYELRGQQTNVWCVAASVQMLLDFYRYEYTQVHLAHEMGLGTLASPDGLPYGQEFRVVDTLQSLTSNALSATLNTSPTWSEFRTEIRANRPLISFIPGHSRTVAGYTRSLILSLAIPQFRGLLVYDPWPPTSGVITRWENFDTQTYRDTFTAHLTLV